MWMLTPLAVAIARAQTDGSCQVRESFMKRRTKKRRNLLGGSPEVTVQYA